MSNSCSAAPNWLEKADSFIWNKLWNPEMRLIYDYIPANGDIAGNLPTAEEISLAIPNPFGWRTGMEDSMINGGYLMEGLISRWLLDKDPETYKKAQAVFAGMSNCADQGKSLGFLPRSLSPADGKTHYMESSRDQYTLFIFAAWLYSKSGMADETAQKNIVRHLTNFAERCYNNATAANEFDLLREDNQISVYCRMRGDRLRQHEVMRICMFYLAAWSVSGDGKYFKWYKEVLPEALEKNETISFADRWQRYELLQMQYSLRLVYEEDPDLQIKKRIYSIMRRTAEYCAGLTKNIGENQKYWSTAPRPWRECPLYYMNRKPMGGKMYMIPELNTEFWEKCHFDLRGFCEGMLVQLQLEDFTVSEENIAAFHRVAEAIDYENHYSSAPMLLQSIYYTLQLVRNRAKKL